MQFEPQEVFSMLAQTLFDKGSFRGEITFPQVAFQKSLSSACNSLGWTSFDSSSDGVSKFLMDARNDLVRDLVLNEIIKFTNNGCEASYGAKWFIKSIESMTYDEDCVILSVTAELNQSYPLPKQDSATAAEILRKTSK